MPLHVALLTTHVNTCAACTVQGETLSTLAAERALSVHTPAVCAHSREHLTLIYIFTDEAFHTSESSRTSSVNLAGFTGAAPGSSQRGAALRLQRGSVDVDLTAVVLYREPASALHAIHTDGVGGVQLAAVGALAVEGAGHISTHSIDARAGLTLINVFAGFRVWLEDKSFRTGACVGTRSVSAQSIVTEQAVHQTLIDVNTVLPTCIRFIADVADAAVASSQVFADAILANVWVQGALVYVSAISRDPNSTAAHRLELS